MGDDYDPEETPGVAGGPSAEQEEAEDAGEDEEGDDAFAFVVAVLIAVVTLAGGLIGWRAAVAAGDAMFADATGLSATLNVEQTRVLNEAVLFRHYRAYSIYTRDQTLQGAANDPALESMAATSKLFFPARYLNRDGSYAAGRERAEAWAQASQSLDLDPESSFDEADRLWQKTRWLIGMLTVSTVSLFCYTFAEALHPAREKLRMLSFAAGTLLLVLSSASTVAIERLLS